MPKSIYKIQVYALHLATLGKQHFERRLKLSDLRLILLLNLMTSCFLAQRG